MKLIVSYFALVLMLISHVSCMKSDKDNDFFARPEQWKSGSVKGLLLRGGITVKELTWNEEKAKAILVSHTEQTITVENSRGIKKDYNLSPGMETKIEFGN